MVVTGDSRWSGRGAGTRPVVGGVDTEALVVFNRSVRNDPRRSGAKVPVSDGRWLAPLPS